MIDDMVKPTGSPCPRRQHPTVKPLREDPTTAQHGIAVESAGHDHQPDRSAGNGEICQTSAIAAVDAFRPAPAARARARPAHRMDVDYNTRVVVHQAINGKTGGYKGRRPEGLLHDVDSFCETNATIPANCIKSESEPNRDPAQTLDPIVPTMT
jgi:hypothetical protein